MDLGGKGKRDCGIGFGMFNIVMVSLIVVLMCLYPDVVWIDLTVHDVFYPLLIILIVFTFLVLAGLIVSVMTKKPSKMMVIMILMSIFTSLAYTFYMIWAHDATVFISSLTVMSLFLPLIISWLIGILFAMLVFVIVLVF